MNKLHRFSSFHRSAQLDELQTHPFDLVIIGGGATGAGIALDAASRGLKTALVEKKDFASGTSSKSTKLIHGGLRYLKQMEIGLVRESGTERAVVNKIAPHLCLPEKMLLPLIEDGSFGKVSTSIGLWVYDFIAGVKKEDQRVMLSKEEALEKEPMLNDKILKGAGYYAEYRTDDARLTIEVIKKAVELGALALNYCEVVNFTSEKGRINGVMCRDMLNGRKFEVRARRVVSAGGPWVDHLRKINRSFGGKHLLLSKGVHLVVPHERMPVRQSVYFDVPDGRMIFAIPRGKITYIGTTDTEYRGNKDRVVATVDDREYLLKAVNFMFPDLNLTQYDVVSNWAGLRALIHEEGKSPSEVSRKDEIFEADNGLISIAGGKLTGYRKMSERIVDKVVDQLGDTRDHGLEDSETKNLPLTNDPFQNDKEVQHFIKELKSECSKLGLDDYNAWYLVTTYGKSARHIFENLSNYEGDDLDVSLALAELDYCLGHEMIQRLDDYFVRRSGRLYFDIFSIERLKSPVLEHMTKHLNWDQDRKIAELQNLDLLIQDATTFYRSEQEPRLKADMNH